jgi:hypothetical protein
MERKKTRMFLLCWIGHGGIGVSLRFLVLIDRYVQM